MISNDLFVFMLASFNDVNAQIYLVMRYKSLT